MKAIHVNVLLFRKLARKVIGGLRALAFGIVVHAA
jgi:hypothetical protein